MKRFLAKAGLAAALTLSVIAGGALTGCGSQNASTQGADEETTATVATSSGQAVSSSNSSTSSDQTSSVPTPTFDFSRDLDDNGHWKDITASDYVTLCDYSSIEIPASTIDVSDQVQKRMDSIVSSAGIDELTDDWVQQNYAESRGWKTVEDMRAALTESYQEDAKQTYIQNYVVEHSTFTEVPQTLLDYTRDYLVYQYTYMASQYNFTLEDLIKMMYGYTTTDELVENNQDTIESQAKMYLAFQAIVEKEGRVADDAELEEHYGSDLDSLTQTYGTPYLKQTILMNDTLAELAANATIVDDSADKADDNANATEEKTNAETGAAAEEKADSGTNSSTQEKAASDEDAANKEKATSDKDADKTDASADKTADSSSSAK